MLELDYLFVESLSPPSGVQSIQTWVWIFTARLVRSATLGVVEHIVNLNHTLSAIEIRFSLSNKRPRRYLFTLVEPRQHIANGVAMWI